MQENDNKFTLKENNNNTQEIKSKYNILLVYATEGEAYSENESLEDIANEINSNYDNILLLPIRTGVGKLNALLNTVVGFIMGATPTIIINIGAVGSNKFKLGDVLYVNKFIQRDFDLTALGEEKYSNKDDVFEITGPFIQQEIKNPIIKKALDDAIRSSNVIVREEGITCGTGDSLVINPDYNDYDVVDMEAYAIAKLCVISNIPFICLKVVSDGSDDTTKDWESKLKKINVNLFDSLKKLIIYLIK